MVLLRGAGSGASHTTDAVSSADDRVTLLFSDMEGFAPMIERLGDRRAHAVMQDHNRIFRHEIAAHGGTEVELQGDGFVLAFAEPRRGLACAIAIQRALAAYNHLHREQPIRVRIGLHAGETIREANKFFGKTVILAARIAAQARSEEILVSDSIRDLVELRDRTICFGETRELELKGLVGRHTVCPVAWR